MWSPDGRTLYFMSDRSGAQNLWTQPPGGSAQALTHFGDGRVVWPSIARNGSSIVFQRDFGVWRYDVRTRRAARVPITLEGAIEQPQISHVTLKDHFQTYSLASDGKKIAFIVRGRLFAADAQTGSSAFRVPTGGDYATAVTWAPDSNSVAFVAGHGHEGTLRIYDFLHDPGARLPGGPPTFMPFNTVPGPAAGTTRLRSKRAAVSSASPIRLRRRCAPSRPSRCHGRRTIRIAAAMVPAMDAGSHSSQPNRTDSPTCTSSVRTRAASARFRF